MTGAPYSETDLFAVAWAGDPRLRSDKPSAEEMALISACVAVEAEQREREWTALELALPYVSPVSGRVELDRWPDDPGAQWRLAEALLTLGWSRRVPRGAADEAIAGRS